MSVTSHLAKEHQDPHEPWPRMRAPVLTLGRQVGGHRVARRRDTCRGSMKSVERRGSPIERAVERATVVLAWMMVRWCPYC